MLCHPETACLPPSARCPLTDSWLLSRPSKHLTNFLILVINEAHHATFLSCILRSNDCWSAHYFSAMDGLTQSYIHKQKLQNCKLIDLRSQPFCHRPQGETLGVLDTSFWDSSERTQHSKRSTTYHQWCALPTKRALVTHSPFILPNYMFLILPRDVICSTARFRLRVHTLRFGTATWNQSNTPTYNLCDTDCPLYPLNFPLYINNINDIAEGVSGAVTGTTGVHV